jgi:hypothetical protein
MQHRQPYFASIFRHIHRSSCKIKLINPYHNFHSLSQTVKFDKFLLPSIKHLIQKGEETMKDNVQQIQQTEKNQSSAFLMILHSMISAKFQIIYVHTRSHYHLTSQPWHVFTAFTWYKYYFLLLTSQVITDTRRHFSLVGSSYGYTYF